MGLKSVLMSAAMVLLSGSMAAAATAEVFKNAGCGCCEGWIAHLQQNGFAVTAADVEYEQMVGIKAGAGITPELESCHTAFIDGYVIEGHVPAADIARLLAERPEAIGLTAPGMPAGSPGMEGTGAESYEVLLILKDGSTEVFASH